MKSLSWGNCLNLILVFILGFLIGFGWNKPTKPIDPIITTTKDSIIRDSIFIVIDSIKTEIKYLEKKHNEETSVIMSNSDSANMEFFTRYLENYKRSIEVN